MQHYIDKHGYVVVKAPWHPNATTNGWIRFHRLKMALHIGRRLERTEHVHHKNGDRLDNRIENLELLSASAHIRRHQGNPSHRKEGEPIILVPCACGCGRATNNYDSHGRPKRYIHGHNQRHQEFRKRKGA